ncbi:hypothetical protein CVM52_15135 [Pseudooceanicola lipolyticus]|uniref:Uncharacterized protein n=1 Tax=Pseudooceanicola lipolyticus TaxID=2029104 RepID=A0A2M8IZ93_9RHOB|nr:hypothetical protein [Pseudooceanicola lipolyticus]PJE35818.1 hypothetical protein CVM52_15135 [Pseudooceanicola lipolyticus]
MTAYVITSVLSGLLAGAYGLVAYGSGIWSILGWYLAGGWAGFLIMIVLVMTVGAARRLQGADLGARA